MGASDAISMARGSPRRASSASCLPIICVSTPCRRWLARTVTPVTAAATSSTGPGTVRGLENDRAVPTIDEPSNAP